jgi:hypothetical protein
MLAQADLQNALAQALGEFGPAWKIVSECSPVNPLDPSHWAVGSQSIHVNIRHRVTGRLKVLGRRVADEPSASLHRAVALSLVDSYVHGNADPIRRYLEDIGVATSSEQDAGHFFRRPAAVVAMSASATQEVAELLEAPLIDTRAPVALTPRPIVESPRPIAETPRSVPVVEPPRRLSTVDPPRPAPHSESPRPALPVAALGSSITRATGTNGNRVLRRFKREFEIWQWRRAVGSIAQKSASTND